MAKKSKAKPTFSLEQSRALKLAWERGLLSYKIHDYQEPLYNALWEGINNPKCLKYTLNVSRRWGKSFLMALVAIEFALRTPNMQIRFAAPTGKALRKITNPIFKIICEDAPKEFKPRYMTQEQMWVFANGSEIHLAGCDGGNNESLRGTASNLNCIDEGGFVQELEYTLTSILMPQTLTTGGTTLIASTPPKTPAHDFVKIAQECEAAGNYRTYTIYDNKTLSPELIQLYADEAGGITSTTFKREYLCQFVVDEALQIIPEWKDDFVEEWTEDDLHKYYHRYVGMDLGTKDFTAVLFGHYNFRKATIYIEDELTMNGHLMTTPLLVDAIREKERVNFGDIKPYRRVSDNNNLHLLQDLGYLHQLHFNATTKESLDAMINEVRLMVGQGRVKIHPRCKMLIGCLKYGIWTDRKDKFARSSTYMHFDHLAALVYLIRNLDKNTNPIPDTYNISSNTHHINDRGPMNQTKNAQVIGNLFGPKFNKN